MQVPVSRTLLRSLISGAVVLLGASACSRSDRVESGSDNTATIQDTAVTGAELGDTAPARVQSNAPRAVTSSPSVGRPDTSAPTKSGAASYRAIERDTAAQPESDSARVTEDTSETSLNQADTSTVETADAAVTSDTTDTVPIDSAGAAGYTEMAHDTTGGADQIDTTTNAAVGADVQDTTMNAGRVRPIEDSTETGGQVTTDTENIAARSDTLAADAAIAARGDDTAGNAGRIRPPEDSTEMDGNVSSAESDGVNAADTADEAPVAPEARESDPGDREIEVASEDRNVGAAAMGGTVTGADAIALMTRQGEQCHVVDPESDEEVRWDMSSTPATLNPCGLGSMNLSKVWTAGQRSE